MRLRKRFLIPGLILLGILAGPRQTFEKVDGEIPKLEMTLSEVDEYVKKKDEDVENLRPDNESRIFWADSLRRTEYAFVYLHGWSASWKEGEPIELALAKKYNANLYAPRLAGHGIKDSLAFQDMTPKKLMESAREAIAIGKILGEKVIVLSCSTGGTLSTFLAAENPDDIYAQMMYSPNIDIKDSMSELLTAPWGKELAHAIVGDYNSFTPPPGAEQYWTTVYSSDGLICLKALVEMTQTQSVWENIKQPTFMAYYHKDDENEDQVVSVPAMRDFYDSISTPNELKREVAFEEGNHCLISEFHIKDLEPMKEASFAFMDEIVLKK